MELLDEAGQAAMANSVAIAARCQFNLVRDLDYEFPSYAFPPSISEGIRTPDSFLGQVCRAALDRKYPMRPCHPEERSDEASPGLHQVNTQQSTDPSFSRKMAEERLQEELLLIKKHGLAG